MEVYFPSVYGCSPRETGQTRGSKSSSDFLSWRTRLRLRDARSSHIEAPEILPGIDPGPNNNVICSRISGPNGDSEVVNDRYVVQELSIRRSDH